MAPDLLLEVIACTVEDAIQAEQGGADRLEIVSHLEIGGLTPPLSMVREILKAVSIPVRVMLRGNGGFETGSQKEISDLCDVAGELSALHVDGIVVGFLRDGKIDVEAISQILASAPELPATFHHAFDASDDRLQSIETLKSRIVPMAVPPVASAVVVGAVGDPPIVIAPPAKVSTSRGVG